jgi:restriction system protein
LLFLIAKRTPQEQRQLLEVAFEGEYWKPTCASCGIKMVERKPKAGGLPLWGCSALPRCRNTLPLRSVAA